jgi:5-deoxy-glucuronate isomerase
VKLHLSAGTTADGPYALALSPEQAGWTYCGLRVLELAPGAAHRFDTGDEELLVVPLSGGCVVSCDGTRFTLAGRRSVFDGVTDLAYAPCGSSVTVHSGQGGRFALASARAGRRLAPAYIAATDVPVELRGAGRCSRQVHDLGLPGVLDADRLMACEVLTPSGNWSSYPPHKHDEAGPTESVLEEIYYFEVAPGPDGRPGMAYQRVYGTAERPIDVLAEVRTGDLVLVPYGWHGPSMAVPGYDLYYLNVMAGPGAERAWLIRDDPAHGWIRDTWPDQEVDPRLPFSSPEVST